MTSPATGSAIRGGAAARRHEYPMPAPLRHPLLYGDWHPLLRDPIDLIRLTYLVGAVVALGAQDVSGAARFGVTAVIVYIARLINVPRPFDLGFTAAMGLQAFGNVLGLFESVSWWDTMVHVVLSVWVAPLFYIGLARLGVVPDLSEAERSHRVGIFVVTLSLGVAFGGLYEIYEWIVDHVFGGNLLIGETDTVRDLGMDTIGSAIGGALLTVWAHYGWQTTRRLPPELIEAGA